MRTQMFCQVCRKYIDITLTDAEFDIIRCSCGEYWAVKKRVELDVYRVSLEKC